MTNQAAQTMPSVDAFMAKWEWLILSRCRDEFVADLAALSQTAVVVEGWKLVPVEPTEEMVDAWTVCNGGPADCYRAMIAAAPAASGGESAASLSSNPNPVTPSLSSESAASVSERARDDLHVAICQAVALMNMEPMTTTGLLQAHDILRKAIS